MSERAFLLPEAKRRTTEAIRSIEAQTAAEVVVTVRHSANHYVGSSATFGLAVAALALVVMFVSPQVYDVRTIPLDALLAFLLGAVLCHYAPPLKRVLTSRARRKRALDERARASFTELGIGKTKEHTGLLVVVALFERTALVVPDEGVPTALLGDRYETARADLAKSVESLDFEAFLRALEGL
ncbi:MAG TPA: hypothetical protein VF103_15455, partial [Polyangiaceae bacterium]